MRKKSLFLLALLLTLLLAACARKTSGGGDAPPEGGNVQIPNPWADCSTLDEAARLAGFDIAIPGGFDGYPNKVFQAMEKSMIQVM